MKLSREITINASADQVWKVLAHDFATIGEWASSVAHSVPNASVKPPQDAHIGGRVCTVPGMGKLDERFTAYDEKGKTYTFSASGMPFVIRSAFSSWSVKAIDAKSCRVAFTAEMNMLPVIGLLAAIPMRMQIGTILGNALEELKYYVETGEIHPRKQKLLTNQKRAVAA